METQEILNKKVGTKEFKKLEAKPVKIVSVKILEKSKDGNVMKSPLVLFECKHPDQDDLISISKLKYVKGENIITSGFWVNLDSDGNIQKSSALDVILNFLKCSVLNDTIGREVNTSIESAESGYLCLKAY